MAIFCHIFHCFPKRLRMFYIVEFVYEIHSLESFKVAISLRFSQQMRFGELADECNGVVNFVYNTFCHNQIHFGCKCKHLISNHQIESKKYMIIPYDYYFYRYTYIIRSTLSIQSSKRCLSRWTNKSYLSLNNCKRLVDWPFQWLNVRQMQIEFRDKMFFTLCKCLTVMLLSRNDVKCSVTATALSSTKNSNYVNVKKIHNTCIIQKKVVNLQAKGYRHEQHQADSIGSGRV